MRNYYNMKSGFLIKFCLLLILTCISNSCNDPFEEVATEVDASALPEGASDTQVFECISNTFDWEAVSSVALHGGGYVSLPWASGNTNNIVAHYGPEVLNDHKASEGWVMLYDLFSPCDCTTPARLLIFYNRYRGILRTFYYYEGVQTSNKTSFGIQFPGNYSTSMLNFTNSFIARPMDERDVAPNFVEITPQEITNQHWYFYDVEIAYDQLAANKSFNQMPLLLKGRGYSEQAVKLDGEQLGSITGNINISGGNDLLNIGSMDFGSSSNYSYSYAVNSNVGGQKSKIEDKASKQLLNSIGTGIKNKLNDLAGDLASNAVNWLANPVLGAFTSLLGSSGNSNPNNTNLTLKTEINLEGSITYNELLYNASLKVPGAVNNGNYAGVTPAYDKPLGVWNLASQPVVEWDDEVIWKNGAQDGSVMYQGDRDMYHRYEVVPSSVNIVINPDADVTLVDYETDLVVLQSEYEYSSLLSSNLDGVGGTQVDSEPGEEKWEGQFNYISLADYNNTEVERWMTMQRDIPDSRVYLRVKLKVQPNNGSDPVYFMKTFKPEFVKVHFNGDTVEGEEPGGGGFGRTNNATLPDSE